MKNTLLTSLLVLLGSARIASGTTIDFVSPGPVVAGQTFTVDVQADSAAIAAFNFDVDFDPTILNADNAVGLGDFTGLSGYLSIDNVGGVISYVYGSTSGGTIDSGTGIPLAELTFTAVAPGDVTLSFANETIVTDPNTFATEADPSANTLDLNVAPASTTPEPSTWAMLTTATFVLWLRRRRAAPRVGPGKARRALP